MKVLNYQLIDGKSLCLFIRSHQKVTPSFVLLLIGDLYWPQAKICAYISDYISRKDYVSSFAVVIRFCALAS
jgi:hypothetical protein